MKMNVVAVTNILRPSSVVHLTHYTCTVLKARLQNSPIGSENMRMEVVV
jgi:hypothetical protein